MDCEIQEAILKRIDRVKSEQNLDAYKQVMLIYLGRAFKAEGIESVQVLEWK